MTLYLYGNEATTKNHQKMKKEYKGFDEYVNPDKIVVTLLNGKKLEIWKKHIRGGKVAYLAILAAFNNDNVAFCNGLINAMVAKLEQR